MSVRELLDKMTPDDQVALGSTDGERIEKLAQLRLEAVNEHLAEMHSRPEIDKWEQLMSALHGPKAKIHFGKPMSWKAILLIARYGEAPYHWPDTWSDDDVRRAERVQKHNDLFFGLKFIPRETK